MVNSRERLYLIGAAVKQPLQLPVMQINSQIPSGARYRLDYIMISYQLTEEDGSRLTPELSYNLFDSRGFAMTNTPVPAILVSSPAGHGVSGPTVRALPRWGIVYEALSVIRMDLTGQVAGPLPATVSITFIGVRDRMRG